MLLFSSWGFGNWFWSLGRFSRIAVGATVGEPVAHPPTPDLLPLSSPKQGAPFWPLALALEAKWSALLGVSILWSNRDICLPCAVPLSHLEHSVSWHFPCVTWSLHFKVDYTVTPWPNGKNTLRLLYLPILTLIWKDPLFFYFDFAGGQILVVFIIHYIEFLGWPFFLLLHFWVFVSFCSYPLE